MKESRLGPRRWAFVVLAGGAACALPFLRSRPDATRSSSDALAQPEPRPIDLAQPTASGSPATAAGQVLTPPATTETLPAWANAQRSPFDELLGSKAVVSPPAFASQETIPIEPLKPWIQPSTDGLSSPAIVGELPAAMADHREGLRAINSDPGDAFGPDLVAKPSSKSAPSRAAAAWPDERVSLEQIAQLNYSSQNSDLVSAIVSQPPAVASSSTSLATNVISSKPISPMHSMAAQGLSTPINPAEPLATNSELPNAPRLTSGLANPVPKTAPRSHATVRFGESTAIAHRTLNASPARPVGPEPSSTPPNLSGLPAPPDIRKKSVIFQPSARP